MWGECGLFGYVKIHKDELKVKEYNQYKAYYCGLCHRLKKEYGFPARYFLSNDATFLSVLLLAVTDEAPAFSPIRCMANPMKRRPACVKNQSLSYAAAVNVLLVWFKLRDDWQDNRSPKALFLMPLMAGKKKKAQKRFPQLFAGLSRHLDDLHRLEEAQNPIPDASADAFAKALEVVFQAPFLEAEDTRRVLSHSGYLLGRFIYLLDAWEDREKDKEKGAYNPFLLGADISEEDMKVSLEYSLGELANSFSLLSPKRNKEIIENIIYLGLKNALDCVFAGETTVEETHHERSL